MNGEKNDVLIKLAICHMEREDYKKALEFCEVNLRKDENSSRALRYVAWCEFLVGEYIGALAHIEKSILLEEVQHEGYYIKGRILLALNRITEATEVFKKIIKYNQSSATYITSLGITYAMRQLNKEAIESFSQGAKLNRKAAEPLYNLALVYEATENYKEAIELYEEVINIDKDFYLAIISKHNLSNGSALGYHYSRFVHVKFRIEDSLLIDREIAGNTKVRGICEDYFKECAYYLLTDDYSKASVLPNKYNYAYMNPSGKLKNPIKNDAPFIMSSSVYSQNPQNISSPKSSTHKFPKQLKPQTAPLPIITPNSFQSPSGMKPYEKSDAPNSLQSQIKPQAISHPFLPFPISEAPLMNTTGFWNQLLESQQRQVQSMMAHGVIPHPLFMPSTPSIPGNPLQIERPQIINPLSSLFDQKHNLPPHQPSAHVSAQEVDKKDVINEERSLDEVKLSDEEKEPLRLKDKSTTKKLNGDQLPRKKEAGKESNIVRVPIHENRDYGDTIVRLNLSLYKPNYRKRKHAEHNEKINKKEIRKHKY